MNSLHALENLTDITKMLVDLIFEQARVIDENETIDNYTKNRLYIKRKDVVEKLDMVLGKEET